MVLDRVQEANPLCQMRGQHCPDSRGARRCAMNDFWWLMNALKGNAALAADHKQKAIAEAKTELERRMMAQVEGMLESSGSS